MLRTEAVARLRTHQAMLYAMGIEHVSLFGSTARDEAHEDSDLDLAKVEVPLARAAAELALED